MGCDIKYVIKDRGKFRKHHSNKLSSSWNFAANFTSDEQIFEIIKGGKGGLGNSHFKSSINQAIFYSLQEISKKILEHSRQYNLSV